MLAAIAVMLLPGAAWLVWFPMRGRDGVEQVATAIGLSTGIAGVAGLGLFLVGGRVNALVVLAAYGFAGALFVVGACRCWQRAHHPWVKIAGILMAAGLGVIAIWWRMIQADGLAYPAWVDSLHHVLIVRKIIEGGVLPQSLQPYLDVPFYYHFGFHWQSALFGWMAGIAADQAVLILGQVINGLVGLAVYRLAKAIWHDPLRALGAALLVTFATHMPAYYLTWGRYTLLLGMLLLPLAMAEVVEMGRYAPSENPERWKAVARLGLLSAGLAFAHYMALVLLAVWVGICALVSLVESARQKRWEWRSWMSWLAGGGVGMLLSGAWLLRVAQYSNTTPGVTALWSTQAITQKYSAEYTSYLWYLLGPERNHMLVYLAGVGLVWALLSKKGWMIAVWSAILALQTLPWGWHLRPFRPDHFAIILFLPVALLLGNLLWAAGEGVSWLVGRIPKVGKALSWSGLALAGAVCLYLCGWGLKETRSIINPSTVLADAADRAAMEWITINTPENARFFINTAFWQGVNYRPVDGGAWILPATGRWELIPTIFFGFGERGLAEQINARAKAASELKGCDDAFWNLVEAAQITHLYLREGRGSLQADALMECAGVRVVYQQGGVSIWVVDGKP